MSTAGDPRPASRRALVAAFAAIYLIWGGTFLALRYAVESVPPLVTIATRCVVGAAILLAWLAARGSLVRVTSRQWAGAFAAGGLLFVGSHGTLAWASQTLPSGRAALLCATIPLWMVVIEAFRTRKLPARRVVLSLAVGMLGIALLSGGAWRAGGGALEHLLLVGAALAWAGGSLIGRGRLAGMPPLQSTAMQLGAGGLLVILASLASGEGAGWSPADVSLKAALSVGFLVIGGTVVAFAAYTWLLQVASPHAVGTYAFVNPVVALLLAWAVGDEAASVGSAAAAALIIGSVALVATFPRHAHDTPSPDIERLHDDRVVLASEGRHEPPALSRNPDQLGDSPGGVLLRRAG